MTAGADVGQGPRVHWLQGLLECLDCASTCTLKVEEESKKWCLLVPLLPERDPAVSSCLADAIDLVNEFLSCVV